MNNPQDAIPMRQIFDQQFQAKMGTISKTKILEDLLRQLQKLSTKEMSEAGEALQLLVKQVNSETQKVLELIKVAQNG